MHEQSMVGTRSNHTNRDAVIFVKFAKSFRILTINFMVPGPALGPATWGKHRVLDDPPCARVVDSTPERVGHY